MAWSGAPSRTTPRLPRGSAITGSAIYATPTGLELRVDGVTQTGTEPIDLGGGRVERFDDGIVIDLPDGTVVWAMSDRSRTGSTC